MSSFARSGVFLAEGGGIFSATLYSFLNHQASRVQLTPGGCPESDYTNAGDLFGAVALGAVALVALVAAAASTAATAWCDPFLQLLQLETDMLHVLSPPFFRKVGVGKCSRGLCDAYSEVPEMKIGWVEGTRHPLRVRLVASVWLVVVSRNRLGRGPN